jgi:hypothetical protein
MNRPQQRFDDANSALSALEAEMDGVEADVSHAEYCAAHPEDHQTCADQDQEVGVQFTASGALEDGSDGTGDVAYSVKPTDCMANGTDANFGLSRKLYGNDCTMEGSLFAIAAGAWWGAKSFARSVMAVASSSNAVGWAVFGAMTAGFALAGGAGYFIQCLQS